jgi:hypothetical protein
MPGALPQRPEKPQRSIVLFHRAFHAGRFAFTLSQSNVIAVFM